MIRYTKYISLFSVSSILSVCLFFSGCGFNAGQADDTEEIVYQITTIPLYINNEIYIGTQPLLLSSEEIYFIPYNIILKYSESDLETVSENDAEVPITSAQPSLTDTELPLVTVEDISYIPLPTLSHILDWHVYMQEDALYIDNFPFDYSWTMYPYIAHAMGGIDGTSYTNSLEAFLLNYENGHRVFEVDLSLTSDNELVAIHDWSQEMTIGICEFPLTEEQIGQPLSAAEFKELKIKGQYTPLSFEDIVELMDSFPDIYIVTDTKETETAYVTEQFQYIIDKTSEVDPALLDRIIPQIYNEDMYDCIMDLYDWNSIIYTLYNQGSEFSALEVVDFSRQNGIRVITTFSGRADSLMLKDLLDSNCLIYMHPYNSLEDIEPLKEAGIHGFYTDFLMP